MASLPLGWGSVPLCMTHHKMAFPGRMGPGLICPQLPKSPVATFTFTTALFVSILLMDRLRLEAQKKIQEESGEQRSLEKVELMGSRSPDAAGGWDGCFVPCDLCLGWALLPHHGGSWARTSPSGSLEVAQTGAGSGAAGHLLPVPSGLHSPRRALRHKIPGVGMGRSSSP